MVAAPISFATALPACSMRGPPRQRKKGTPRKRAAETRTRQSDESLKPQSYGTPARKTARKSCARGRREGDGEGEKHRT